ncbi:class I SAM-dependent methyltransferase [Pseudonocardia sp.]|uniref:class I SAM-dependent methyltransferase n=1 Tax=Pseudonocardia sp. TaxID=60912 RepID=UPI003D13C48A
MKATWARLELAARRALRRIEGVRDRKWGIRTSDEIELAALGAEGSDRNPYAPSRWSTLEKILPPAEVTAKDVFLDLGCGMGRVLLVAASRYRFRAVIGVEVSAELCEIARANVVAARSRLVCEDVQVVEADVLDYNVPDDVSVVFIYNSFGGHVFAHVVDGLVASFDRNPRDLRIVYHNPVEEAALLATGRILPIRAALEFKLTPDFDSWRSLRMYVVGSPSVRDVADGTPSMVENWSSGAHTDRARP